MLNTTTPRDLAQKIECIGFQSLSRTEKKQVEKLFFVVRRYLSKSITIALSIRFDIDRPEEIRKHNQESANLDFNNWLVAQDEINHELRS